KAEEPKKSKGESVEVKSSLPGNIYQVLVEAGASVKEGDTLIIIEAMKMETKIAAPSSGTIEEVVVKKGDVVQTDDTLLYIQKG
ncbi:MAG: biotin/lipoyl-binding protein, partial [Leptospiraceae bacterium]|nr:biotin/lipoyl-binding protein [Leptospiraceae bacterium]